MALASAGASTPFITNTPSNAVTLASVAARLTLGLGVGVGLGAGFGLGLASALDATAAEPFFDSAALFVSGKTGAIETDASIRLQSHRFRFISYSFSFNSEPSIEINRRNNLAGGA